MFERVRNNKGVEGYAIADRSGNVPHPADKGNKSRKIHTFFMKDLTTTARDVVRGLNLKQHMCIRVSKLELVIVHGRFPFVLSLGVVLYGVMSFRSCQHPQRKIFCRCHPDVDVNNLITRVPLIPAIGLHFSLTTQNVTRFLSCSLGRSRVVVVASKLCQSLRLQCQHRAIKRSRHPAAA